MLRGRPLSAASHRIAEAFAAQAAAAALRQQRLAEEAEQVRVAVGRTRAVAKALPPPAHLPAQPPAAATAAPTAESGNRTAAPRLRGTWTCDESERLTLRWQLIDPPDDTTAERQGTRLAA